MTLFDQISGIGSLADDDDFFPGRDMRFEPSRPTWIARRDWARDAAFEVSLRGHLLEDGPCAS